MYSSIEDICEQIIELDNCIRFAGKTGKLVACKYRMNVIPLLTLDEITTSTNGSNMTLGTAQAYTEYDKTTGFKPAIVNGTHGIQISFTGHGILNGINITDNGNAFLTNITGGAIYTSGRGTAFHGFTFEAIGHHGADGKLRDTGTIFNTRMK